MKNAIMICAMCLMALTMRAQKCVVLDFQLGNNITTEELDRLTNNFRANFRVAGYTMFEHTRINRTIEAFGYNRTGMTMQQMLTVGRELDAKLVVSGSVNKFMDEYSVAMRVIDVATGATRATEGATFTQNNYRTSLESLAATLGRKVAGSAPSGSGTVSNAGSRSTQKTVDQGYTDLGMPSGTIWKNSNATGLYTYDEAVSQFGNRLPSKEQWEELKAQCQWSWTGSGYKVTGPNGNSIFLPAAGVRNCSGSEYYGGSHGNYWSSTPGGPDNAWYIDFGSGSVYMYSNYLCYGRSVRLVQD